MRGQRSSTPVPQQEVAAYLAELTNRLEAVLGDDLLAAWVVGSGALGDFDRRRSDIDVQAVSQMRLSGRDLRRLATALSHEALPCPVRGLEFVLYARDGLDDPEGPAFQLNLNTGPAMSEHHGFDPQREPRFWFTLDVAIARDRAHPLAGAAPASILPQLPRSQILRSLREALAWYRAEDETEAVLAACRAWAWATDGVWLSKGDAAKWAIARLPDPAPVAEALQRRTDPRPAGPSAPAAAAFLDTVRSLLELDAP
jgi:hypothetical protein